MIKPIKAQTMPLAVTALLGFIAGFVDICSYFGLFGIFVAQLTGSFVLAGARIVSGQQEFMTVAAIPTFFAAGCVATAVAMVRAVARPLAWVLALECLLLTLMLALVLNEPLAGIDAPATVTAVLLGIAAMSVQSAMVRLFMHGAPSTNVMTTNTSQMAIDTTTALLWLGGMGEAAHAQEARARLSAYVPAIGGFLAGTAIGALCFDAIGIAALAAPLAGAYGLLVWSLRRPRA